MAFGFCRYEHLFLQKTLPFSLHHVLHSYDIPQQPESSNSPVACLRQADIWHPWGTALCHESMGSGQINTEIKPIPKKQQSVSRIRLEEALVQGNVFCFDVPIGKLELG